MSVPKLKFRPLNETNNVEDRLDALETLVKSQHVVVSSLLENILRQQRELLDEQTALMCLAKKALKEEPGQLTQSQAAKDIGSDFDHLNINDIDKEDLSNVNDQADCDQCLGAAVETISQMQSDLVLEQLASGDSVPSGAVEGQTEQSQPSPIKATQSTDQKPGADGVTKQQEGQGCYINWERSHDVLKQHLYIPVQDFNSNLEGLFDALDLEQGTMKSALNAVVEMMNSQNVINRKVRFPKGLFININTPLIQNYLMPLCDCNENIGKVSKQLELIFEYLVNLINTQDILTNRMSFEQKYNLFWNTNDTIQYTAGSITGRGTALLNTTADNDVGGYINWDDEHKQLEMHCYVPLDEYKSRVSSFIMTLKDTCSTWHREIRKHRIKEALSVIWKVLLPNFNKIDKSTRFPRNGLFINFKSPLLVKSIDEFQQLASQGALTTNITEAVFSNIDTKHLNVEVHNVWSFEKTYKLKWVDRCD